MDNMFREITSGCKCFVTLSTKKLTLQKLFDQPSDRSCSLVP